MLVAAAAAAAMAVGCQYRGRGRVEGEYERAEAVVAAGGLRKPPTKSPNRIPFGFQASLHRVNNVFTRRFGSFAVGRASFSSSLRPLLGAPLQAAPSCVPIGVFSHFFPVRLRPRAVCGRPVGVLHVPRMSPAPDYEY